MVKFFSKPPSFLGSNMVSTGVVMSMLSPSLFAPDMYEYSFCARCPRQQRSTWRLGHASEIMRAGHATR